MSTMHLGSAFRIRAKFVAIGLTALLIPSTGLSASAAPRGLEPPTCFDLEVTILGTAGADQYPDSVDGTAGSDVIHALAGSDNIYAIGLKGDPSLEVGNDFVCAGRGHDDPVEGGGGDDHIAGGRGSDSLFGNVGNDTILGGFGFDEIEAHEGNDLVNGGPQRDEICAGPGNDEVKGAAGADSIGCGETGADRYFGGPGDDVISSVDFDQQTSPDVVNGGVGTDICSIDPEDIARNCETIEVV